MAQYSISVHSSDVPQSMAGGTGFAILHGPSTSSSETLLVRQTARTFQSGAQDIWVTCDMQDLGALQRLIIGLKDAVGCPSPLAGALPDQFVTAAIHMLQAFDHCMQMSVGCCACHHGIRLHC